MTKRSCCAAACNRCRLGMVGCGGVGWGGARRTDLGWQGDIRRAAAVQWMQCEEQQHSWHRCSALGAEIMGMWRGIPPAHLDCCQHALSQRGVQGW